jgi:hypothetical protein
VPNTENISLVILITNLGPDLYLSGTYLSGKIEPSQNTYVALIERPIQNISSGPAKKLWGQLLFYATKTCSSTCKFEIKILLMVQQKGFK